MISAIVYNSCTGSCKKYAELLSAAIHAPAMPLKSAYVRDGGKVIYVSWIFAGKVCGLEKAAAKFNIAAVIQVGMSAVSDKSEALCREKNSIPRNAAVFCRQGGFNINKLPLPMKLIMKLKCKEIAARLESKAQLNEQEQATLTMASTGVGEPPRWDIDDIVAWAAK